MERKTSVTYRDEILEKYRVEKGGEMSSYLIAPTRKQIKEACMWLLDRRNEKYDDYILNRFFQFKEGENKLRTIDQTKGDKFKPIVNFLTGETKSTTLANLELIAWLIDFKPRPLSIYLKSQYENKGEIEQKESNYFVKNIRKKDQLMSINEIRKNLETKVIQKDDKSITIISQINPSLKITTIVSL